MKKILFIFCLIIFILNSSMVILNPPVVMEEEDDEPAVEIAFCIDISASTDSLLNNFKSELWDFLWDINKLNEDIKVRIAIVGSGRAHYLKENNYINLVCPLTENPDELASKVYGISSLKMVGKPNYVGSAISMAVSKLKWSENPASVKLIYVIGNGPLLGKGFDAYIPAQEAVDKGFKINAIFCLNPKNGKEVSQWEALAKKGRGDFKMYNSSIASRLAEPLKKEFSNLELLNTALNNTYSNFTREGIINKKYQVDLDSQAIRMHPAIFQSRIMVKSSELYQGKQFKWDLVDFLNKRPDYFETISDSYINSKKQPELNPQYKLMNVEAIETAARKKENEREQVIAKIQKILPTVSAYLKKQPVDKDQIKNHILASLKAHILQ